MFKSSYDIIKEATTTEEFNIDNIDVSELKSELQKEFDSIEELEDTIYMGLTPGSVRVVAADNEDNSKFYIDFEEIFKLAESMKVNESEALDLIVDHYSESGVTKENTYVVLADISYYKNIMLEASKENEKECGKAKKVLDKIKDLKNNKINLKIKK